MMLHGLTVVDINRHVDIIRKAIRTAPCGPDVQYLDKVVLHTSDEAGENGITVTIDVSNDTWEMEVNKPSTSDSTTPAT